MGLDNEDDGAYLRWSLLLADVVFDLRDGVSLRMARIATRAHLWLIDDLENV